ncbi:MAG TPA: tRNA (N6-isopentenyl adenosine(37)-C2)-methylthiotransferase MiaB [Longimicrobiales bacterium]|nr:tRNA (N6-isopentenyl adenosine(37)-C2)-methylthiotransferase MiaB [Longimicrobiales bacterium]
MTPPKRAYVETYGCQMNISDGELMQGILEAGGYEIASSPEEADVILVNTCAIREHAEQRVLGRVGQLKGLKLEKPGLLLGVTGCMAQRMGDDLLAQAPYVDLVMGPDGYRSLPDVLESLATGNARGEARPAPISRKRGPQLTVLELDTGENYEGLEQRRSSSVAAWVPIQRGCDHRCTFCIVPYVRGPEKNRKPTEILSEIAQIAGSGVTEVTLLGQTVNSYRYDGWGFPDLLKAVARVPGIRRVRFTSPHPNDVTPELVEVMATEEAVCEQLHLPVQAGNDRTLKRMTRRYTVESYLEKVEMVRAAIPDIALSTDVIVAFPGETEAEFRDTLELMRTVRFDDAFTYRYSPREGTPATRMPREWFIPDAEAQARLEELIEVARGIQTEINQGEVGRVEEILVEKPGRDPGYMLGRTRRAKVVVVPGGLDLVGEYRIAELETTTGATFAGRVVEAPGRRRVG